MQIAHFITFLKKIIPDLVVTLDPHMYRIIRWFGDENLKISNLKKDNYFRKQDLDVYRNEIKNNRDVLKITKKYGSVKYCSLHKFKQKSS